MSSPVPVDPKIYHIIHVDRLNSIIEDGRLYSDAIMMQRGESSGTTIGMTRIKERRLTSPLSSHVDLKVGECVPFYFCPRSVMLYVISCRNNPDLSYCEGQQDIIHLELNMDDVLDWAKVNNRRCAFTTSNAGSYYFDDFNDFSELDKINWDAVQARDWQNVKEEKQAEFLLESELDWTLIDRIGVYNSTIYTKVSTILDRATSHKPKLEVIPSWYY